MAGARTRTLSLPASGVNTFGERGRWLEVIDGGIYGYRNTLTLSLRDVGDAVQGERDVPCVPGTVVVADFDELTLKAPAAVADTVVVRMGDGRPPEQLTGKPRVRWLARGDAVACNNGAAIDLWNRDLADVDDYSTRERYDFCDWIGWVWGSKLFALYATARANPGAAGGPTTELVVQQFVTETTGALPPGISGTTGIVSNLNCDGVAGATVFLYRPLFLPNTVKVQLANIDATPGTFSYLIGVKG